MRLKTYSAPTLNEAMSMAREELGGDAVIVSTLELENEVRLTAALEEPEGMDQYDLASLSSADVPGLELVCERLEHHNIPRDLSELIMSSCAVHNDGDIAQRLVKSLNNAFRFCNMPTFEEESIPTLLVGAPGVGKTLTLARLAYQASHQGHSVHIITTDAQKAGSLSQIASLGTTHSLSVSIAKTPQELTREINMASPGTSLLIDTPGINPFNESELSELAELILAVRVSPILALTAGGDEVEQQDLIEAFSTLGASRVILTKIDLSRRLGGQLAAIHKTRAQLMGYGNSPHITQPLHNLGPEELALLLLDDSEKLCQVKAA